MKVEREVKTNEGAEEGQEKMNGGEEEVKTYEGEVKTYEEEEETVSLSRERIAHTASPKNILGEEVEEEHAKNMALV